MRAKKKNPFLHCMLLTKPEIDELIQEVENVRAKKAAGMPLSTKERRRLRLVSTPLAHRMVSFKGSFYANHLYLRLMQS